MEHNTTKKSSKDRVGAGGQKQNTQQLWKRYRLLVFDYICIDLFSINIENMTYENIFM